jgi:guanylate kinase
MIGPMNSARLVVLSGPSGVGKDTVLAQLARLDNGFSVCATATTRPMRDGESEGNPYLFLSVAEFEAGIESGAFLEHARVNGGNYYGTPKAWVESQLAQGIDVILKIDVQGGASIRQLMPDSVLVFLAPPSMDELERRLRARATEAEDQIQIRLDDARMEIAASAHYDYRVVNDSVEVAADRLRCILIAERCRIR